MLEGKTDSSRHWREQPDKFWSERFGKPVTPRWVLQYFGTEVCRQGMLDSIWIDSCLARYKGQNTVISDTRFVNEIMESGAHQSEWDWIGSDYDYILENTHTIESLNKQIFDMTNHLLPSPQSAIPNPEYF